MKNIKIVTMQCCRTVL